MHTIDSPPRKPATHTQIAALEFKACDEMRALTKEERIERLRETTHEIYQLAVFSSQIVVRDKDELVKIVEENYENFGPFLMQLARGHDRVQAVSDLLRSAECRLAAALAVIEPDED